MSKKIVVVLFLLAALLVQARKIKPIEGVYYGTNYTVPFAHAYRALGALSVDRKEAIDRDVYHMARLGLNAYRLHLWDVELSDSIGNLIENDHLDLLDYLLSKLESYDISIILTAQTNFGNGYPERNSDPYGAFNYKYDKCQVHEEPEAIAAQVRYISQLVRHVNPYTGKSYAADPSIIAIEINNEPCHTSSAKQVTQYINTMARAMRSNGWNKTILYNVSHNMDVARGYFDADIDGTTYQWYPLNLVSGHTRYGNFMPFVDQYDIPFRDMPNYNKLSRVIYEYDPADNLYSYVFPAAARTFRKEGFCWVTQFAYDPIDIAWANTEYQTHYLNLAYTPGKALGMMVAAEVMRQTPSGADYGKYPCDTVFGDFLLSPQQDLAVVNDGQKFYYTNNTTIHPKNVLELQHVAGLKSSPVVQYAGSGAYFLDRVGEGIWRLELMPDMVLTQDPFAKPSLSRSVGDIIYNNRPMTIALPGLSPGFEAISVTSPQDAEKRQQAVGNTINVAPGVYLLANAASMPQSIDSDALYGAGKLRMGQYVAPAPTALTQSVVHKPAKMHSAAAPLTIKATAISAAPIDSMVLYPSNISFWNEHNRVYKMENNGYGDFSITIDEPATLGYGKPSAISYNLVVWQDGLPCTYPAGVAGTPLDWDYNAQGMYTTELYYPDRALRLLSPQPNMDGSEISTVPAIWTGVRYGYDPQPRPADDALVASVENPGQDMQLVVLKYVGDIFAGISDMDNSHRVMIETGAISGIAQLDLALITSEGLSYNASLSLKPGVNALSASDFKLSSTLLCPEPFPVFLSREFSPCESAQQIAFRLQDIENIQIIGNASHGTSASFSIKGLWIE